MVMLMGLRGRRFSRVRVARACSLTALGALAMIAMIASSTNAAADEPARAASPPSAVIASPAVPGDTPLAAMRARLAGHWSETPGVANAASRNAGVQQSVNALFVLIRGLASRRLLEANPVFPAVRIAFTDGQIEVRTGAVVARSPEGGVERTVIGLDRATNRLTQTLSATELVQTTWNDDGSRTTRLVASADGRALTVHIQIRSPRLPVPVTYSMTYARAAD